MTKPDPEEDQVTEEPEYPAQETRASKPAVGGAQAAVDATFNAHTRGEADDVEAPLRAELADLGDEDISDGWITETAAQIRRGDPVVVEPAEQTPPEPGP